jgi:hypothetical protein
LHFTDVYNLNRVFGDIVGLPREGEVWDPRRFLFNVFLLLAIFLTFINGLVYHWGDWLTICQLLQGAPLSLTFIARTFNKFREVDDEGHGIRIYNYNLNFLKSHDSNPTFQKVLVSGSLLAEKAMKIIMYTYFFVFLILGLTPIIESFVQGENVYLLPIKIPFLDNDAYLIYQIFILFSLTLIYIHYIINESALIYCSFITTFFVDVLVIKAEELGCQLQELKGLIKSKRNRSISDVEEEFIEIMKQFDEYRDYTFRLKSVMTDSTFVAVAANGIGISLAVITLISTSIPRGLACLLFFILQVGNACIAGTLVNHQNQRLLRAICDFPWYELSLEKQKVYLQFIFNLQNPIEVKLPMLGYCNMELFKDVVYAGYQYYMFLINFVKF